MPLPGGRRLSVIIMSRSPAAGGTVARLGHDAQALIPDRLLAPVAVAVRPGLDPGQSVEHLNEFYLGPSLGPRGEALVLERVHAREPADRCLVELDRAGYRSGPRNAALEEHALGLEIPPKLGDPLRRQFACRMGHAQPARAATTAGRCFLVCIRFLG